jgi:hypothetical protein
VSLPTQLFLADHPEANLYVLRTLFAKSRLGFALSDQSKLLLAVDLPC